MHQERIVYNLQDLRSFLSLLDLTKLIAADVETYKQRPTQPGALLLGLALTGQSKEGNYESAYIVFHHYNKEQKRFIQYIAPHESYILLAGRLRNSLIGWNVPFDKMWLDEYLGVQSNWMADGRVMWHLQNNDPTIRGFGLKLAQKKLLGWEETNEKELEENVKLAGGRLSEGDHYLADLEILAKYACLDTYSTLLCYEELLPFMEKYDYMWFHDEILHYAFELKKASIQGLNVDESELMHAAALYKQKREQAAIDLREICKGEINAIEEGWKIKKASLYRKATNRTCYLSSPSKWKQFNPSSGPQREMLIHTLLEFPINERTPTGRAKTDRVNLSLVPHEGSKTLLQYSEYKKIAEQAQTYLKGVEDGRLYTNYDVCGTVSGRLSGFRPSVLNMPFSETEVMHAFKVDLGYVGIHADLASIEPCVLGHYSGDPTLLKVYKEGLGDIYLDLALDIFPNNQELKEGYNPNEPIKVEVKERFKDLRSLCKIVHLAVSYTGTYVTVAKNLTKYGYPTTKGNAMSLVRSYWAKFKTVKAFEQRLQEIYEEKGSLRNITGRVIQVPIIYKKDLMNRLVQSSAHDILRLWVMQIIKEFNHRGVEWRYWLPDLHDSTTFMVKEGQEGLAGAIYQDSLKEVEKQIGISVPLKMELKLCRTLAGLKGHE